MIKNSTNTNDVKLTNEVLNHGELYNRLQEALTKVQHDKDMTRLKVKRYVSDELSFCFYRMKTRQDLIDVLQCIQDNNMYDVSEMLDDVINCGIRGARDIYDELWNHQLSWMIKGGEHNL